ncbi:MAG: IclR family transcriptional regulator, partial [Candidatus Dormibacteraceae bacterium]
VQATEETVHLAVLDGFEVVYVEKIVSLRPFSVNSEVGRRSPAYCTAVGKAALAFQRPSSLDRWLAAPLPRLTPSTISDADQLRLELATIRENGFATDSEESEPGLCCLAAPVFDHSGQVVAAVGIAAPKLRMVPNREAYQVQVLRSALRISALLGYPNPARSAG